MEPFEKSCEKPQRKQLKKCAEDPEVNETVRQRLPDRSVKKCGRIEEQSARKLSGRKRKGETCQQQQEECAQVDEDQAARSSPEVGKCELA